MSWSIPSSGAKRASSLLGVLRAAEEDDPAVGEAPPVLHVHRAVRPVGAALVAPQHMATTSVSLEVID